MKKQIRYGITFRDNSGIRKIYSTEYESKEKAKEHLSHILSKPKKNEYGITPTAYRDSGIMGGGGVNNPRIKKFNRIIW